MSVALMASVGSGGRAISGTAQPSLALRTCGSGAGGGQSARQETGTPEDCRWEPGP